MIFVHFDGGSLQIEGEGAQAVAVYGFTIRYTNKIWQSSKIVGVGKEMSSNYAEYSAVIAALKAIADLCLKGKLPKSEAILIRGDSKMVCKMVAGEWGVKNPHGKYPHLKPLLLEARSLMPKNSKIEWVPRENNKTADALCNRALNEYKLANGMRLKYVNRIKKTLDPVRIAKRERKQKLKQEAVLTTAPEPPASTDYLKVQVMAGYRPQRAGDLIDCQEQVPESQRVVFGDIIDDWNATPCKNPNHHHGDRPTNTGGGRPGGIQPRAVREEEGSSEPGIQEGVLDHQGVRVDRSPAPRQLAPLLPGSQGFRGGSDGGGRGVPTAEVLITKKPTTLKTYKNNNGKVVGLLGDDFKYRTHRWSSKHLLRVMDAWGLDKSIAEELKADGCKGIRILDHDGDIIYSIDFDYFMGKAIERDFGNAQLFLPRSYWENVSNKTNQN